MAVGNALMDMYNEMQAELAAKENCEAEKPVKKVKKVPKQGSLHRAGQGQDVLPRVRRASDL